MWGTCKAGFVKVRGICSSIKDDQGKAIQGSEGDKTAFRHDHGRHWGSLTLSDQAPVNRADAEISSTGTDTCPMGRAAV